MQFKFLNKKISGILTVIPDEVHYFDDEVVNYNLKPSKIKKLKKQMGFYRHRIFTRGGVTISELATFGIKKILNAGLINENEIGALVVVTQTPDYFAPPTSNIVQGRLNLPQDVYCLDIGAGCSGYVTGLIQAFQLSEHMSDKKVLLVAGDILTFKHDRRDQHYSATGDAVSISVVENSSEFDEPIFAEALMDGTRYDVLRSPKGSLEVLYPSNYDKYPVEDKFDFMDGAAVSYFVLYEVPPLVEKVLCTAGKNKDEIDYLLCHQPNKFLVDILADALKIPCEKVPDNVVSNFGNSASATIPINICFNLTPDIFEKTFDVCLAGFGVGLSWAAMTMKLGKLNFCEFAEYSFSEGESNRD